MLLPFRLVLQRQVQNVCHHDGRAHVQITRTHSVFFFIIIYFLFEENSEKRKNQHHRVNVNKQPVKEEKIHYLVSLFQY